MKNMIKKFSRELEVVAALAVIMVVFGVIQPIYFSPSNLLDILDQSVINGLLAIGMTLVIITAGIDLTVGSTLAIVIVSVGNFLVMGLNPFAAVFAGAAIGFVLGLVNGILVAKMKLQPFVATLGMMSVYRGVAYLITGGWPVLNIPQNFRDIMDGDVIGTLSSSMILFLIVTVAAYILLKHTKFGTYLYSIGSNEEATRLSGVNVDFNKIMAYAICGVCVAFAGMVMLAKLGTGEPAAGASYDTNAIAAAAIGGTSLAGGKGSIIGTFLGAILLQALKVGLVVCGVDTFWQYIATGLIIVFAVYVDVIQEKLAAMRLNKKAKAE